MSNLTKAFIEKKNGKYRSGACEDFHEQTPNDMLGLITYQIQTELDWLETELRDILSISLRECVKRRSIRILVDALDECFDEGEVISLIDWAQDLITKLPRSCYSFGICFSCREYPILSLDKGLRISVDSENEDDINTFISHELQREELSEHATALQEDFEGRASGNFQWAVLVLNNVRGLSRRGFRLQDIQSEVRRIPKDISDLYYELLKSIKEGLPEERRRSVRLLQWVCFGFESLTLIQLRDALAIDLSVYYDSLAEYHSGCGVADTAGQMQRRLIDLSRGLAELREHAGQMVVQFNHQTVYDFLRDKGFQIIEEPSRLDMNSLSRAHHELARCCILYFATKEILWAAERDIPSLDDFLEGRTNLVNEASEDIQVEFDEIDAKMMIKSYPFISYATEYWLDHAELAERNGISQEDLLNYFRWPSDQILRHWIRVRQHVFSDRSEAGLTLMHIAAKRGLLSLCRAIAEKAETKNDVDKPDDNGWTPLMHAAACEGREAIVEFLLNQGANPNTKDGEWETPLFKAASQGDEATARLLLEHGADPNLATLSNDTPLSIAVFWEHDGMSKLLLKQGADSNIPDDDGETPLLHAARGRSFTIAHQLLKFKTDPNGDPLASETPLIVAVKQKDQPLIALLLKKGADPDRRDAQGRTPLDHAVRHDFRGAVQTLVKYKANPDCTDKLGQTPLFHAASFGRVEIVQILLAAKASPTLGSSDGKTPLERAESVAEGLKMVTNADDTAQRARFRKIISVLKDPSGKT